MIKRRIIKLTHESTAFNMHKPLPNGTICLKSKTSSQLNPLRFFVFSSALLHDMLQYGMMSDERVFKNPLKQIKWIFHRSSSMGKENLNLIVHWSRSWSWSFSALAFILAHCRQINKLSNTWLMTLILALLNYEHVSACYSENKQKTLFENILRSNLSHSISE